MLGLVFLVLALLLAIAAAANVQPHPLFQRIHWGWAAFSCYIAHLLFGRVPLL
jgi:hypothetical protein